MRRIYTAAICSLATLGAGCVTTGPKIAELNFAEATAFERSLQARQSPAIEKPEARIYTQPVNKKEPCKLPTTEDQLARSNFRAYWDGQCKDGFAFGLGRDIAISATHHMEEIAKYTTGGEPPEIAVHYNFVDNKVLYGVIEFKKRVAFEEKIQTNLNQFYVEYSIWILDGEGGTLGMKYSPFKAERFFLNNSQKNVAYKFTEYTAPVFDPLRFVFSAETVDPQTMTPGGVTLLRAANGQSHYIKLDGAAREPANVPVEYINHISGKYSEVASAVASANSKIEQARQLEREYLFMACNGKHTIDGLDKEISTKICTWRDQFKVSYDKAAEKYKQELEAARVQAEAAQKERQARQIISLQQQQQAQLEMQQAANAIAQFGQQFQNSSQQALQNVMTQPVPQVAPFAPLGGNQVRCVNTGVVTNCRY